MQSRPLIAYSALPGKDDFILTEKALLFIILGVIHYTGEFFCIGAEKRQEVVYKRLTIWSFFNVCLTAVYALRLQGAEAVPQPDISIRLNRRTFLFGLDSAALDTFEAIAWGQKFQAIVAAWRNAWERVIAFFAFPPAVRKVIYTTNAIESVNVQPCKSIKARGHFPSDEAATKLIWLAPGNITKKWSRQAHGWETAMNQNQFAILFAEGFVQASCDDSTRPEHEILDRP